ncbi:MAG: oligosaccharide flippase family protein [Devosia sp.]|nr:oligosaccharide flippase family protein [Devosia sp.]
MTDVAISARELKNKTFFATIWTFVRIGYTNLAQFVFFVFLARLLNPTEFGTFSVAAAVYQIVRMIAGAGLGESILRAPAIDEELLDTVFWGAQAFSVIGALVLAIGAIPYGMLLAAPEVVPVLQVLSGIMVIGSLSTVHVALKMRAFGHRSLAIRTVISTSAGGLVGVGAALAGAGTWSLVIQTAAGEMLGLVFWWTSVKWHPTFKFSLQRLWPLFNFGVGVTATQISWLLLVRVQDIIITRFLGLAAAAAYRVSWRMIDIINQMTFQPIGGVTNITLAKLQQDPAAFRRAYLRFQGLAALPTMPAIAGFGVLAPEIIHLLFGAKWASAAPVAQILAFLCVPFCVNFLVGPAFQSLGASAAMSKLAIFQLVLTTAFSIAGAMYFGLVGVAAAYVIRAYLTVPLQLLFLHGLTGIGPVAVGRELLPPVLGCIVMTGVVLLAKQHLGEDFLAVAALVAIGAASYFAVVLLVGRRWVMSHLKSIGGAFR